MINYITLEEQVDADFTRARRRAFLRRAKARLRSRRNDLSSSKMPSFEELSKKMPAAAQGPRGLLLGLGRTVVRVEQIVGSVGRSSQFDRGFMPAKRALESRWKRIDRAFHRGVELPPVSLYKVGDSYYVLDGNHRVSVARYHGVEMIEAEVEEFGGWLAIARPQEEEQASAA